MIWLRRLRNFMPDFGGASTIATLKMIKRLLPLRKSRPRFED
jgi:hypothetical protein